MLKKTIRYTDYNGTLREEDFYFNLSKAEAAEWELSITGGLSELLKKIIAEEDITKLVVFFKEIILRSYGEKSEDGRRFIKSDELSLAFSQMEAYSELFMELSTNADAMAAFVSAVIPEIVEA